MAKYDHVQRSFSGGEISGRMAMRDDAEVYSKSLLTMENFMPTLQGTAVRTPGSRFLYEPTSNVVRIIPYYTPANERAMVELTPGACRIITNLTQSIDAGVYLDGVQPTPNATTPIYKQIVDNHDFDGGYDGWDATPISFQSPVDGENLGWAYNQGDMLGTARDWKNEYSDLTLSTTVTVPEDTTKLIIAPSLIYVENFSGIDAAYTCTMSVGTTAGGTDIWTHSFNEKDYQVGYAYNINTPLSGLNISADTVLYITVKIEPEKVDNSPSTPQFRVRQFGIYSTVLVDLEAGTPAGTMPYTAAELPDVQYVQSPYTEVTDGVPTGSGKELVFTHPNHPPQWLRFDGGQYIFEPIAFYWLDDQGVEQSYEPPQWQENNYPACCSSFNGRLMLGGSQSSPLLGSPTGSATETVWGTKVGEWSVFSDPNQEEVFPDDSIEFTAIYRSPIQWLYGQKNLLIGAREMEYTASADGIFQPADLGVSMQSTHGSSSVQPVGLGQTVLFPAEGGKKVRAMNYQNDDQGWVAPDLTLTHPTLFNSGIVRMVRMRNPHQMVVVVMGNGQVALLHQDTYAGVQGWSRINLNANVKDACVIPDSEGVDVLYLTVNRWLNGTVRTYVEAFRNWVDGSQWEYTQSASAVIPSGNVIAGIEHLAGRRVQVIGDGNYLGTYTVSESGTVTLTDSTGEPIFVTAASVGLSMQSKLVTLPIVGNYPGSKKRYSKISVRGIFSSRVKINGERPKDRTPMVLMGNSQPLDIFADYNVANLGWDATQTITIEEDAPVRSELQGVFGNIQTNSV